MKYSFLLPALLLTAASAGAQSAPTEVSGNIGAGFRTERGRTLGGARLEGALRLPATGWFDHYEFGLGYAQVTAHRRTADSADVKENSFELGALGETRLAESGAWRLTGAVGPVVAISSGCTGGDSFNGDSGAGSAYGRATCENEFAKTSNVRAGGSARLVNEFRKRNAAFTVGAHADVGTIAAGDGIAIGVFIGFRAVVR